MILFGCDSSSENLEMVLEKDEVLYEEVCRAVYMHDEMFFKNLSKIFRRANLSLSETNAFGIVSGPGSFTGLRVGYAVVKTLCYALKIKLFSFNVFELLFSHYALENTSFKQKLFFVMHSNANRFYGAFYDERGLVGQYLEASFEELKHLLERETKQVLVLGSAKKSFEQSLLEDNAVFSNVRFNGEKKWDVIKLSLMVNLMSRIMKPNTKTCEQTEYEQRMSVVLKILSNKREEDPLKACPFYLKNSSAKKIVT